MAEKHLEDGGVYRFRSEQGNLIVSYASDYSQATTIFKNNVKITGSLNDTTPNLTIDGSLVIDSISAKPVTINAGGTDKDAAISFEDSGIKWHVGINDGVDKFRIANGSALSSTTALTIDSSDRIGIGTDSPDEKIHIVGKSIFEGGASYWSDTTPGTTTGTIHLDPGVTTDHHGGAVTWGASDASNGTTAQAGIYVRSDGSYGTKMYFGTTDSYASGSKVAMMIDDDRQVGIGTINPEYALDVSENRTSFMSRFTNENTSATADGLVIKLGIPTPTTGNSYIYFRNGDDGYNGHIKGDGSGGVLFTQGSDIRLKQNIVPTKYSIANLLGIEIVDYEYKSVGITRTGVIAQQAIQHYPDAIIDPTSRNIEMGLTPGDKGFEYMEAAHANYIPLLMKSLQDAYNKILELEKRMLVLENINGNT